MILSLHFHVYAIRPGKRDKYAWGPAKASKSQHYQNLKHGLSYNHSNCCNMAIYNVVVHVHLLCEYNCTSGIRLFHLPDHT